MNIKVIYPKIKDIQLYTILLNEILLLNWKEVREKTFLSR